jgi:nifR3 family TIM-barrel protein
MAGVSLPPFRIIARELGAGACVTELISANALSFRNEKTLRFLKFDRKIEKPFWVQIFGSEPEVMAQGALIAKDYGAEIIDINMGCPVPKVVKKGAGAALLGDIPRAQKIVEAVKQKTNLPVTAKIRSGWDAKSINCLEVGKALEAAGVDAITIHPRTRAQGFAEKAEWSLIKLLADNLKIPVIGNGDIFSVQDARRMFAETRCAAVMIGRAALGNPFIFEALAGSDKNGFLNPVRRWEILKRHFLLHLGYEDGNEKKTIRSMRAQAMWYSRGLVGAASFRRRITSLDGYAETLTAADEFFHSTKLAGNFIAEREIPQFKQGEG